MKTKLISFDVWGTLLGPNPAFREQVNKLICTFFERDINSKFISKVNESIKFKLNEAVNLFGIQPNVEFIFGLLLADISSNEQLPYDRNKFLKFITDYQRAAIKFMPLYLENNTKEEILNIYKTCKEKDYKLVISSNTMFLTGDTMNYIITTLFFDDVDKNPIFTDMNFSGDLGISKPDSDMFYFKNFKSYPVFHVGNDLKTDGGCVNNNIKYIHLFGEEKKTISDVYTMLFS